MEGNMTEIMMRELIDVLKQNNSISWETIINIFALVASWITIAFLLVERKENTRPYLQISFELVRDNLTCLVFRNVGTTPITIKKLEFEKSFIKQLADKDKKHFEDKNDISIDIFPNKYWIISLGVTTSDILQKYENKILAIKYEYSRIMKKKRYKESVSIDFDQYSGFMVYISEIDELKSVNKKICSNIEENTKQLKQIYPIIEKYANLEDRYPHIVIGSYEVESIDK
jgi:hypothetical protein